jgi:hypothetical protein
VTRAVLIVLALAVLAVSAPAVAHARATVDVMVVGKRAVVAGPKAVALKARTARVGARRCAVGKATPLSALVAARVPLRISDRGACSRRPRDAGSLYVERIGHDRARGRAGWVYKVGRKAGTTGAADPSGSFGTGRRLRDGDYVLWFWCGLNRAGSCQRTLEARPDRTSAAPGAPIRVTVRGYDDHGRGERVEGAVVRIGDAAATTGADGVATVAAPAAAGEHALRAEARGMVPAFPTAVRVG